MSFLCSKNITVIVRAKFSLVSKEHCIDIKWYHFFMFQVTIWWIYDAITKQAICRFVLLFLKGVMSKAISFSYFIENK